MFVKLLFLIKFGCLIEGLSVALGRLACLHHSEHNSENEGNHHDVVEAPHVDGGLPGVVVPFLGSD